MKALRGNGKRALAVVAAALVAVGAASQAMSSPRAPTQNTPPGFSSSAAVKSMRARHAALAKLGEVAQGAPREGLTSTLQIARHFQHEDMIYGGRQQITSAPSSAEMMARHFQHEDALYQLSKRGESVPTPRDLRANGLVTDAAFTVQSGSGSSVSQAGGFAWGDWAIGIGTGIGLALLLGVGIVVGRQYRHRVQPV
jgi:hypothetical protein